MRSQVNICIPRVQPYRYLRLSVQGTEGMVVLLLGETRYTEGTMVEEERLGSGSGLSELRTSE